MEEKKEHVINVADIPDKNGITDRQKNNQIPHNIPIGTLVEFKFDEWLGNGACKKVHARMFVWKHERDCDGTPLYTLSPMKNPKNYIDDYETYFHINRRITEDMIIEKVNGLTEEHLTVIELTKDIEDGKDSLQWDTSKVEVSLDLEDIHNLKNIDRLLMEHVVPVKDQVLEIFTVRSIIKQYETNKEKM